MSAVVRLLWQRPLRSNGALNILQSWASGGRTRELILMKFGIQQQIRTTMTVTCSNIKIFKIQNGGRPPCWKKYSKYHNSPTNGPTGTQLGWSHAIMCPICPPWCGCYGNGRCLVPLPCNGALDIQQLWRLKAERVNQIWWNLVYDSKFGQQWQSRDQILKFSKFKMADGRCWKIVEIP